MLINRLAILLAERSLSGSRLSVETGIAQSTISKITSNKSKQVDYATVNTICNYLQITPSEFFEYTPIDFELSCLKDEYTEEIFIYFKVLKYDTKICTLEFSAKPYYYINQERPALFENSTIEQIKKEYIQVEKILVELNFTNKNLEKCDDFFGLPVTFQNVILGEIKTEVGIFVRNELINIFKEEFSFNKTSFVNVQFSNFDVNNEKHRIDFTLRTNIDNWAEEELPF